MPVLETVARIRQRLGYDDMEVVNEAIEFALGTASVTLEGSIRTQLARATVVDIFMVIQGRQFGIRQSQVLGRGFRPFDVLGLTPGSALEAELKLSRGFVDDGQTINVFVANRLRDVNDADARVDLISPTDFTLLEAEKGVMRIHEYLLRNSYVRVEYTAGYSTDGGSPDKYETTGGVLLPDWLVEAAALKTTILLNGNPVVRRDPLDPAQISSVQMQLDNILIDHSRYAPGAAKPRQSSETLI